MFLFSIWNFLRNVFVWITETFRKPKLRVRTIDMRSGKYIYGTVEKTTLVPRAYAPEPLSYWTIVWDDAPGIWKTVSSMNFVWYDSHWTLVER